MERQKNRAFEFSVISMSGICFLLSFLLLLSRHLPHSLVQVTSYEILTDILYSITCLLTKVFGRKSKKITKYNKYSVLNTY